MSKLLLFSLFLLSIGSSGAVAAAIENAAVPDSSDVKAHGTTLSDPISVDRSQDDNGSAGEDVCFNIHAYIFKTDNDGVPRLVRESTCMPGARVRAKKANQNVQPRLLPATGNNSF